MRKIFLLNFLFLSLFYSSQQFQVTPLGLRDKDDLDKDYVVINVPDKSANDLYKSAIKYINQTYNDPKVIEGKTENEYLSFKTFVEGITIVSFLKVVINAIYTTELRFKNGKVRLQIIELKMPSRGFRCVVFKKGSFLGCEGIYNKKGKLRLEKTKNDLETYFNQQIKTISQFFNGKELIKDDW